MYGRAQQRMIQEMGVEEVGGTEVDGVCNNVMRARWSHDEEDSEPSLY